MSKLWQDLDKIKVFATVVETGKMNKASELLHLTQPSITRSLQKLEESFGAELFVRHRDGVSLTQAGKMFYEEVSRFLISLDDLQLKSKNQSDVLSGHIVIGTYESLAEYLWPEFLLELQVKYPSLHLSVRTNQEQDHLSQLAAGKIDLLVDAEPRLQSTMMSWPLYKDHFSFYCHPNFDQASIDQTSTKSMSLIYVKGARDSDGYSIEEHLVKQKYVFAREYCFDSFSTAKSMTIKGIGTSVLPQRLAKEDESQKRIRKIRVSGFSYSGFGSHTIYMSINRINEKDLRLKKLISLLRTHFRS